MEILYETIYVCMHIFMYECIHVYMLFSHRCVCIYADMHKCVAWMHVCRHAWIYECIHVGTYVLRHTWVLVVVCMYVCLCACMFTKSLSQCNFTHIWYVIEQIWLPHCKFGCIEPTFLHMCAKTQATAIPTSHVIAMYVVATNMPLTCHICKLHITWHNYVIINALKELTWINSVTRSTCIHTFHIIGMCTRPSCH